MGLVYVLYCNKKVFYTALTLAKRFSRLRSNFMFLNVNLNNVNSKHLDSVPPSFFYYMHYKFWVNRNRVKLFSTGVISFTRGTFDNKLRNKIISKNNLMKKGVAIWNYRIYNFGHLGESMTYRTLGMKILCTWPLTTCFLDNAFVTLQEWFVITLLHC